MKIQVKFKGQEIIELDTKGKDLFDAIEETWNIIRDNIEIVIKENTNESND